MTGVSYWVYNIALHNVKVKDKHKVSSLLYNTAVRPASTLKNTVILAATLFSGARVYYAFR